MRSSPRKLACISSQSLNIFVMMYHLRRADVLYYVRYMFNTQALLENVTVQPEFATFFLGFMRGSYDFLTLFNDLQTLDPELYK